jgi:NADPH:quinone reductase-like Zn-dependent oxidoreductase
VKAVLHHGHGGPEALTYEELPDPWLGPGDALVEVRASALNHLDVLQRQGPALLPGFSLPHIAGMDVAGVVAAVGPEVEGLDIGTRVLVDPAIPCGVCPACRIGDDAMCPNTLVVGGNRPGGYAELCAVPARQLVRLPDRVDFEEAATIPTVYSTAWHALVDRGKLRIGEVLLVHAAGIGVTIAAIQIAKRCGATVIATSASDEKLALAAKIGADFTINNRTEDIVAACRKATGGRGVDIVFDHVGPAFFEQSIRSLRPRGRMVFCGTTSGTSATFNLTYAYHFGITLLGLDPYSAPEFAAMLEFYWGAGFEPVIDSRFPLAEARAAHGRLESGVAFGKILLVP